MQQVEARDADCGNRTHDDQVRERRNRCAVLCSVLSAFLCCVNVFAQVDDKEPVAVLELGGSAGWSLKGGSLSLGPTTAVEVTPIEKWLELEMGITPAFGHHATEWDTDLLFKKPWTLSPKVEFMFGAGPVWVHTRAYSQTTNSVGGEVVLDFMFWPSPRHRFGWYLEPAYQYNFGQGHDRSIGISGGLLVAIPRRHSIQTSAR